ncbi:hypothetical protein GCM10011331_09180 [Flavimobilis marinus]|nr:hypothetical protein GCM10011331_09180 [Flavimobilis marinus]
MRRALACGAAPRTGIVRRRLTDIVDLGLGVVSVVLHPPIIRPRSGVGISKGDAEERTGRERGRIQP